MSKSKNPGETAPSLGRNRSGLDKESIRWSFAENLKYTLGVDKYSSTEFDKFIALALTVRDRLINQWLKTQREHHSAKAKRVYYLSLEFLMGRAMGNNILNLGKEAASAFRDAVEDLGYNLEDLRDNEVDAGLGNGGLGRLAACFIDSLATMDIPCFGYGIRYDYGIFRQIIENGYQIEQPDDWLRYSNPWEIERPEVSVRVRFGGRVQTREEKGRIKYTWVETEPVIGLAYDMPTLGYGGSTVNTLRLWSSRADEEFNFKEFNEGDYIEAVSNKVSAENLAKCLYPNDNQYTGKELRLKQQYFFVACSLHDIIRRFKKSNLPFSDLPKMAAIQMNDTHPSIAVAELMRILMDDEDVDWGEAWEITVNTLGYTNHTLMPEALEKWPVFMFEKLLPRHLQIIYEINFRFLAQVAIKWPSNPQKLKDMSIIEEGDQKKIRMAYLAIVGSHSTNGVAALHSKLLAQKLVPDFYALWPQRFNNKTNGITQRRWLLKSNPQLAALISDKIGDTWITDFSQLKGLLPFAKDPAFQKAFAGVKQQAKERLSAQCQKEYGFSLDTSHLFDVQVKRIHEYKRQLLNALHIIMLYNRIKAGKTKDLVPRTYIFAGKAAPGYAIAKLIIKLVGNLGQVINNDPDVNKWLQVRFLGNYRVSLAEKIIPAANISEQISTAGTEASGTGNMKFMANGALTIGTLDGANIEIMEECGKENIFIFGMTAEEIETLKPHYNPRSYYDGDGEIKAALDLLRAGHFNFGEPGIFDPIWDSLFNKGDEYFLLGDLRSYADAQDRVVALYKNPALWNEKAIINVAKAGKFSSDRTIAEYAKDIWNVKPVKITRTENDVESTLDQAKKQS